MRWIVVRATDRAGRVAVGGGRAGRGDRSGMVIPPSRAGSQVWRATPSRGAAAGCRRFDGRPAACLGEKRWPAASLRKLQTERAQLRVLAAVPITRQIVASWGRVICLPHTSKEHQVGSGRVFEVRK